MLIGELSKRTGFSHDTIRFYERKGLIEIERKARRDNNYKEYSEDVYDRLVLIKTIKKLGFTLNEIDDFINGWTQEDASCRSLTTHITSKIARVDAQIKLLEDIRINLNSSLAKCVAENCEFEKMIPRCLGEN